MVKWREQRGADCVSVLLLVSLFVVHDGKCISPLRGISVGVAEVVITKRQAGIRLLLHAKYTSIPYKS